MKNKKTCHSAPKAPKNEKPAPKAPENEKSAPKAPKKGVGEGGWRAVYGGLSIFDDHHGVLLYIIGNNGELCKIIGKSMEIIEIHWKLMDFFGKSLKTSGNH